MNDKDCYISNFYRALQHEPDAVSEWADWPVNEADLHARHLWLVNQDEFRERMKTDPDFYDPKIAGWWVWGISCWIGGGWCNAEPGGFGRETANRKPEHRRPHLSTIGSGVTRVPFGRTVDGGCKRQLPHLLSNGKGINRKYGGLLEYFQALAQRLRKVRVCCGDFERVLGPCVTWKLGLTGVFLDPPYSAGTGRDMDVYSNDCGEVAHRAREWAIANGDNPLMRIVLCGYEGEHEMPDGWDKIKWSAGSGYAVQRKTGTNENRHRERL